MFIKDIIALVSLATCIGVLVGDSIMLASDAVSSVLCFIVLAGFSLAVSYVILTLVVHYDEK